MKKSFFLLAFVITTMLASCSAIEGIFKAGVWAGILFVVLGIGLVVFIVSSLFKKK